MSVQLAQQVEHFGSFTNGLAAASADPDNDLMDNAREFMAGTQPTNSVSVLRAAIAVPPGGVYKVSWSSVGGKAYRVLYSDAGTAGVFSGIFTEIPQDISDPHPAGTPGTLEFIDDFSQTGGPPAGVRYYRVLLR